MKRTMINCVRPLISVLFLLCAVGTANAQFKGIQGTVIDTTGGLVPEAKVTLTNNETAKTQEVTTSSEGFYRISNLAPGKYTLTTEKAGYKKSVLENVEVNAEAIQGMDVALEIGEVTASVIVDQESANYSAELGRNSGGASSNCRHGSDSKPAGSRVNGDGCLTSPAAVLASQRFAQKVGIQSAPALYFRLLPVGSKNRDIYDLQ